VSGLFSLGEMIMDIHERPGSHFLIATLSQNMIHDAMDNGEDPVDFGVGHSFRYCPPQFRGDIPRFRSPQIIHSH
jgi:hypothetical protein